MNWSQETRRWLWVVIAVMWFARPADHGTQSIGASIAQILEAHAKYYSEMLK